MKPNNIDKLIREKLESVHDVHAREIEAAKPFVWSSVQSKMHRHPTLPWFHLVAAVVLLLIGFSFTMIHIQKQHRNEMQQLTNALDKMEQEHVDQREAISRKENQIKTLSWELQVMESKLVDQKLTPTHEKGQPMPQIIYRTDTIFIRQPEYRTVANVQENPVNTAKDVQTATTKAAHSHATDHIIYPSYHGKDKSPDNENLRVRLGPILSSRN
ncbi:MAG: hypothetical protein HC819_06905 [Cyclobacteriaceae bacterium]|nr:hypothetical protein [Cyclobacteriaceae bacterium]